MHDPIIILPIRYCNENYSGLDQWMRWSPSTRFRYILDRDLNKRNFDFLTLEKFYPRCETVSCIVNPYTLVYRNFSRNDLVSKKQSLDEFVQNTKLFQILMKDQINPYRNKINSIDHHILRNEYFFPDLRNLEKKLGSPFVEVAISKESYNHKKYFSQPSLKIIKEFFSLHFETHYQDFE
jgi:hypothetical protein